MADQGKWFKLWCAAMRDDDLENLSIHDWFGWVRFGAHMKENGKLGKIRLRAPATAVVNLLRVSTFSDAVDMLKRFPNYEVESLQNVTVDNLCTVSVKCKNWNKYQGDWSRDRVRKMRKTVTPNVTAQEEKRSRREEKRREEIIVPHPLIQKSSFARPTPEEVTAYATSVTFTLDGRRFCDYYDSNGWRVGRTAMKDWKAAVRTWKRKHEEENPHASNGREGISEYAAYAERARKDSGLRKASTPGEVFARIRGIPLAQLEAKTGG